MGHNVNEEPDKNQASMFESCGNETKEVEEDCHDQDFMLCGCTVARRLSNIGRQKKIKSGDHKTREYGEIPGFED